jgi:tetratricopeptide (TPR) repeat protein
MTHFLLDVPIDWSKQESQHLRDVLKKAYDTPTRAMDIAQKVSGFPTHQILWNQNAQFLWRDILEEASKAAKLPKLIDQILSDEDIAAFHSQIISITGPTAEWLPENLVSLTISNISKNQAEALKAFILVMAPSATAEYFKVGSIKIILKGLDLFRELKQTIKPSDKIIVHKKNLDTKITFQIINIEKIDLNTYEFKENDFISREEYEKISINIHEYKIEIQKNIFQTQVYTSFSNNYEEFFLKEFEDKNKEANKLYENLSLEEALKQYQELLSKGEELLENDPINPKLRSWVARCRLNVGACLCLLGKVDQGRQLFLQIPVSELTPKQRLTLSTNLAQVGEIEAARQALPTETSEEALNTKQLIDIAADILPTELSLDPWLRVCACRLLLSQGQLPTAVQYATEALDKADKDTQLRLVALGVLIEAIARLYWEDPYPVTLIPIDQRKPLLTKIEETFRALFESTVPFVIKESQKLSFRYAIVTHDEERLLEAKRRLEGMGWSVPQPLENRRLVIQLTNEGRVEEAIEAIDNTDHPWQKKYYKALAFGLAQKDKLALEELLRAAEEYPSRAPVEIQLAKLLSQEGRYQEALSHAQLAFQVMPGRGQRFALARTLLDCKEYQKSLDTIEPLSDSQSIEVIAIRAQTLEKVRRREAPAVWKAFLDKNPTNVVARHRLAILLYSLAKKEEAAEEAWKAATEESFALGPQELDQCIRLQHDRERKIQLLKKLKEKFPDNAEADAFYFEHWTSLSEPKELPTPNIDKGISDGYLQKLSIEETKKRFEQERLWGNSVWSAYHQGSLSLEFVAKDRSRPLAQILQITLYANGLIEAPLGTHGQPPNFADEMELLTGELELLLLHCLGLLPALERELAPKSKLLLFGDVLESILQAPHELTRFAKGNVSSIYQQLNALLSSKVGFFTDFADITDPEVARKENLSYVHEEPLPEEVKRISPRAFLLWLQEEGYIEPARLQTLLQEFPNDDEGLATPKTRIMVSESVLFRLFQEGLLEDIIKTIPSIIYVGPQAARVIRGYTDEASVQTKARESAEALYQWIGKGQREGWIQSIPRPTLDEVPALRNHKRWDGLRRGTQLALSWKKALLKHPKRRLLSADHFTTAVFDGGYTLFVVREFAWTPEATGTFLREMRSVRSQMISFVGLVRTLTNTQNEETPKELRQLAKLGFLGSLLPSDLIRLFQQYRSLQKVNPQDLLDRIEHQAQQQGHSGAPLANSEISLLYAEAIWTAFQEPQKTEDPRRFATELFERLERLERRGMPGRLDDCFWYFLIQVKTRAKAFLKKEGERFFLSEESPAGHLWNCITTWTKEHPTRKTAFDRAARDAVITLDSNFEPNGPPAWTVEAIQQALSNIHRVYTPSETMPLAMRAMTILSANWSYRPMSMLEIPANEESTSIEELLAKAAQSLTEAPLVQQQHKPDGVFLFSFGEKKQVFTFPLEAVLLRASPEVLAKLNPDWIAGYASRDGKLYQTLQGFLAKPDDPELRRKLALDAAAASWAVVREDPTVILQWGQRIHVLGDNQAFPKDIDELRILLSEPGPLPNDKDIFEVVEQRISEGAWSTSQDLHEVFWQATMIPGGLVQLCWNLPAELDAVARSISRILQRLSHPQNITSAQISSDVFELWSAAVQYPTLATEQGKLELKQLLPGIVTGALQSCIEDIPDSLAAAESTILQLCSRVVVRLSEVTQISIKEGLWLSHRLFQWLVAHLEELPGKQAQEHLQTLVKIEKSLPEIVSSIEDALNPNKLGKHRFDQRLASLLYALLLGDFTIQRAILAEELSPTDAISIWSEELERILLSLAQRPLTKEEKSLRILAPPSMLEWRMPASVPDLALFVILRLRPQSFFALEKEAKVRYLSQLFKTPKDDETMPKLVALHLLAALAEQVEQLDEDERKILGRQLLTPVEDTTLSALRSIMLFGLLRVGEVSVREEVQKLTEEVLTQPEGPELFTHYLTSLALLTPELLAERTRQLLLIVEATVQDPVLYLLEIEKLTRIGDRWGGLTALALFREFAARHPYKGDPRIQIPPAFPPNSREVF